MKKRMRTYCLALLALGCAEWASDAKAQPPTPRLAISAQAQNPPLPEPWEPARPAVDSDRLKPIGDVHLPIFEQRPMPRDLAVEHFDRTPAEFQPTGASRPWAWTVETWESPAFCFRPLYFNDEQLERYGYSHGLLQPAVSTAKISGRVLALPALLIAMPPHECIYPAPRERPGTCVR